MENKICNNKDIFNDLNLLLSSNGWFNRSSMYPSVLETTKCWDFGNYTIWYFIGEEKHRTYYVHMESESDEENFFNYNYKLLGIQPIKFILKQLSLPGGDV